MESSFPSQIPSKNALSSGGLLGGFQQLLDGKYRGVRATAQREWERCHAGKEPSDACVSVRISGFGKRSHALPAPKLRY